MTRSLRVPERLRPSEAQQALRHAVRVILGWGRGDGHRCASTRTGQLDMPVFWGECPHLTAESIVLIRRPMP